MKPNRDRSALIRSALLHALHSFEGAAERWLPIQRSGATDEELLKRIRCEFGIYGGATNPTWHEFWGGKTPILKVAGTLLQGRQLIAAVREVLAISQPFVNSDGQLLLNLQAKEADRT